MKKIFIISGIFSISLLILLSVLFFTFKKRHEINPQKKHVEMVFKIYGVAECNEYHSMQYPYLVYVKGYGFLYRIFVVNPEETHYATLYVTAEDMNEFIETGAISVIVEPANTQQLKIAGQAGSLILPIQEAHQKSDNQITGTTH
ncbi:MAG: hypothetical protein MJB14_00285 [Spirochaetes bacterium]|nr:hypothetical protein [Spirochaetota bacterium]